jgi:hypothetical protein
MVAQVMVQQVQGSSRYWTTGRDEKQRRLRSVSSWMKGPGSDVLSRIARLPLGYEVYPVGGAVAR